MKKRTAPATRPDIEKGEGMEKVFGVLLGLSLWLWQASASAADFICESPNYKAIYGYKRCGKPKAVRHLKQSVTLNYVNELGVKVGLKEAAKAIATYKCTVRK